MSEELPKWAEDEINSITEESFKVVDRWEGTGYFLDIDEKNRRVDIQFYEKLPIGKHIITVEVPEDIEISKFMKGFVYMYKVKVLKADFSEKLTKYLKENLNLNMDGVYRFVLESLEMLDDVGDVLESDE
ncbi:MAG: hypothetical protein KatS3mg003_1815 [Candidatus Nitrosocaldaceae archaeon]|nr:MAG: hypothetical protein KatS3mg003_1815 [Candidatus Nitrosocaldaceae archaeon]